MNASIDFDDGSPTVLSTLRPDPVRSARTRQRCRAALHRRVRVAAPAPAASRTGPNRQPTSGELALRDALAGAVGILCLVYVVELIATTVSLQGTIR